MKTSIEVMNKVESISLAAWTPKYGSSSDRAPTHGGNIVVKFTDGSEMRLPMSFWFNQTPEGRRPNISGCIDRMACERMFESIEKFQGECTIDNPNLRYDPSAKKVDKTEKTLPSNKRRKIA